MPYALFADLLLILHLGFVLFVVFGGLLAYRWPWLIGLHLPALVWGISVELFGWMCPLTPWEKQLRQLAGASGYPGGFIEHYLMALLYPAGLTRELQWLLALLVLMINSWIYLRLWRKHVAHGTAPHTPRRPINFPRR